MSRLRLKVHRRVCEARVQPPAKAGGLTAGEMQMADAAECRQATRHRCHWVTWNFSIGQRADYSGARAVVMDRHCTIMGHQVFKIWLVDSTGDKSTRYVLSGALI